MDSAQSVASTHESAAAGAMQAEASRIEAAADANAFFTISPRGREASAPP